MTGPHLLTGLLSAAKAVIQEDQNGGEDREEGSKAHHDSIACALAQGRLAIEETGGPAEVDCFSDMWR